MDNLLAQSITYGALERTLQALGFREETYETHRLYKQKEQGAVIVLPRDLEKTEKAHAAHLLTARHTITGMGIADEAEFEELLAASEEPRLDLTEIKHYSHAHRRRQTRKQGALAAPPVEAH